MLGKKVADFSATATGGDFKLSAHKGHPVVLYFYPKDNTPGCTTEGMQFRDLHRQFAKAGAVVVGVSRDSLKSHENFRAKMEFPFALHIGRGRAGLRAIRRHQDEEHVWQEGQRDRTINLPDRTGWKASVRMEKGQSGWARTGGFGRREGALTGLRITEVWSLFVRHL